MGSLPCWGSRGSLVADFRVKSIYVFVHELFTSLVLSVITAAAVAFIFLFHCCFQ